MNVDFNELDVWLLIIAGLAVGALIGAYFERWLQRNKKQ